MPSAEAAASSQSHEPVSNTPAANSPCAERLRGVSAVAAKPLANHPNRGTPAAASMSMTSVSDDLAPTAVERDARGWRALHLDSAACPSARAAYAAHAGDPRSHLHPEVLMKQRSPAILLGAAGLAWLLGQAFLPDMGTRTADRYDAVADATTLQAWSAALLVIAGVLLVLGAFATSRALVDVRDRGARLIPVGAAMLALGGVWLVGGRGVFNMTFLRVTNDEVPRDVALTILDVGVAPSSSRSCSPCPACCSAPACLRWVCAELVVRAGCRSRNGPSASATSSEPSSPSRPARSPASGSPRSRSPLSLVRLAPAQAHLTLRHRCDCCRHRPLTRIPGKPAHRLGSVCGQPRPQYPRCHG